MRGVAAAGLALLFVGIALWQVSPALDGAFLADDLNYIVHNAYVHELSWENLAGILDPWGEPTAYTANYAPVHLVLHALEYAAFGPDDMTGWHAVNAVAHALASLVVLAFLLRAGLAPGAAIFGGLVFLAHPANVETVAWIFQLKTLVSLALGLGALLCLERRPALATGLLALALLTKITALSVLPVAAVWIWVRARPGTGVPARWGWLAAWIGVALVVAALELQAYGIQHDPRIQAPQDPWMHARQIVAIAMRYLAMAYTTWGLSAFHQPDLAPSWTDPWWLAGLAALAVLGWRTAATLWRREEEAAFWVLAAASFAPVSQIVPFIYPMGDRYLYPILPGLIGGTLLVLRGPAGRLARRLEERFEALRPAHVRRVAAVAALVLVAALAIRSHERAPVYRSGMTMTLDAALRYPDGLEAHLVRGIGAARRGDAPAAARAYGRAVERGYSNLHELLTAPYLAAVRDHPAFREVIRDLAGWHVQRLEQRAEPSQMELVSLGRAYRARGDLERGIAAYERALEREGPLGPSIRESLRELRRERDAAGG